MWSKRKMLRSFKENNRLFLTFLEKDLDIIKEIAKLHNKTVRDIMKLALRYLVKQLKV